MPGLEGGSAGGGRAGSVGGACGGQSGERAGRQHMGPNALLTVPGVSGRLPPPLPLCPQQPDEIIAHTIGLLPDI